MTVCTTREYRSHALRLSRPKALDDALARQPATNERKELIKRLAMAMSRHLDAWEQELETDSLDPLADALEDVLE